MSSNEEYLDNLLKSMGDEDADFSDNGEDLSADIDAMYAELEQSGGLQDLYGEPRREEFGIEEIPGKDLPESDDDAPTLESTQDISQEEIESMLAAFESQNFSEAENAEPILDEADLEAPVSMEDISMEIADMNPESVGNVPEDTGLSESTSQEMPAMDKEEEDILALLDSINDDDGVNEINDLLSKSDNNEAVDDSIFAEETESSAAEIAALLGDEGAAEEPPVEEENGKKKNKKEKKEKVKKEKVKKEKVKKETPTEEQDGEEKAPKEAGFFGKLFSKLTEEHDVEPVSEENQNIMNELDAEDAAEAGKKKKVKKGLMPGKKGGEEEEGSDKKGKKGNKKGNKKEKPKKESKPKKEKPKKEPAVPEKPGKKISKASIFVIVLFAGTVFCIIFFASSFLSGMLQKQRAKDAFASKDYMSCYAELYGLNLSEEENIMFHHAKTVLKVERRLTRYERYLDDYQLVEALDTLMQALVDYDELYAEAQSYGAETEVNAFYNKIYDILERDYGLSREAAHAIAFCDSKLDYTRYLTALAAGEQISASGSGESLTLPETEMQDVLPEEEELSPPTFLN